MIIAAVGVILSFANLAYQIYLKQNYGRAIIALALYVLALFAPAIVFFIGFLM